MVSSLTFRSLIHFEFSLLYWCEKCSINNFIFTYSCPFFPALLIKKTDFSPLYMLYHRFTDQFTSLFCPIDLSVFLCQYHTVSMTTAL